MGSEIVMADIVPASSTPHQAAQTHDLEADCVQRDFATLTGLAWKALRAVNSPHIDTAVGKPARRYRIGPAAKRWALAKPERLVRDYALHLMIRDLPLISCKLRFDGGKRRVQCLISDVKSISTS